MNSFNSDNKEDNIDKSSDHSPESDVIIINVESNNENIVAGKNINVYGESKYLPPADGVPPFKGLSYFDVTDSPLFFGRERITKDAIQRLQNSGFLVFVGNSGAGKSSIMRAGVIASFNRETAYPQVICTPTEFPLLRLAKEVMSSLSIDSNILEFAERMKNDYEYLRNICSNYLQNSIGEKERKVLIFIDQFEELFSLSSNYMEDQDPRASERGAFVKNLLNAYTDTGPALVMIAIRSEFYGFCDEFDELSEILPAHQINVGPMKETEIESAIEKPAHLGEWTFEPGLIRQMIDDSGAEPGFLPFLSHALLETWKQRSGHKLTRYGYDRAGGVKGAVKNTAERCYISLTDSQKIIAQHIFVRLVQVELNSPATRRRVPLEDLLFDNDQVDEMQYVIEQLINARLIVENRSQIEIAHEVLIKAWIRLDEWISHIREDLVQARRISNSAAEWSKRNYRLDFLFRGEHLENALRSAERVNEFRQLSQIDKVFLLYSMLAEQHPDIDSWKNFTSSSDERVTILKFIYQKELCSLQTELDRLAQTEPLAFFKIISDSNLDILHGRRLGVAYLCGIEDTTSSCDLLLEIAFADKEINAVRGIARLSLANLTTKAPYVVEAIKEHYWNRPQSIWDRTRIWIGSNATQSVLVSLPRIHPPFRLLHWRYQSELPLKIRWLSKWSIIAGLTVGVPGVSIFLLPVIQWVSLYIKTPFRTIRFWVWMLFSLIGIIMSIYSSSLLADFVGVYEPIENSYRATSTIGIWTSRISGPAFYKVISFAISGLILGGLQWELLKDRYHSAYLLAPATAIAYAVLSAIDLWPGNFLIVVGGIILGVATGIPMFIIVHRPKHREFNNKMKSNPLFWFIKYLKDPLTIFK